MKDLKVILLCSSRFAIATLRELVFFNSLAVVAIPRYCDEMIEKADVILHGKNIPVIKLEKDTFSSQISEACEKHKVNLGLVMTFPYKIPDTVYSITSNGFYNIHPGPLPQYRGADPIFQQLTHQEKQAGVTIHKLDEGFDTGALVMLEMLKIDSTDTYGLLTTKLGDLAARLTGTLIKLLSLELTIASKPQDESKARYFKRQQIADIAIHWQTMDADSIISLIRACNPWNKGAVAKINNQIIRLLEAVKSPLISSKNNEPGCVLAIEDQGVTVSTLYNEAIVIKIIYAEEGFLAANYISRLGVAVGNCFGTI